MAKAQTKKKELATVSNSALALPSFNGYQVVRQVTMPTFKIAFDMPMILEFTGEIFKGEQLEGKAGLDENGKPRAPVDLVNVIDHSTGEVGQIVVPAVLKGNLESKYPDADYIGKLFGILKTKPSAGKRYNNFQIVELAKV